MRKLALVTFLFAFIMSASMLMGCGVDEDDLGYYHSSTTAVEHICVGPQGLTQNPIRLYGGPANINNLINGPEGTLFGFTLQGDVYALQISPKGLSGQWGFKPNGYPTYTGPQNPQDESDTGSLSFRHPETNEFDVLWALKGNAAQQKLSQFVPGDPRANCAQIMYPGGFEVCWDKPNDKILKPGYVYQAPDYLSKNTTSYFNGSGIVAIAVYGNLLAVLSVKSDGSFQINTLTIDKYGVGTPSADPIVAGGTAGFGQELPTSITVGRNGVYFNGRGAIWMYSFKTKELPVLMDIPPGDSASALVLLP